ncbi:HD-GYP domain-containing protein [Sphaerochaeta sp.]|uniref:HD-GYP domain-containing protein n=1 Tax=Sphaerochaeta sp. TaxID=1972642 RepID=UPI002FC98C50
MAVILAVDDSQTDRTLIHSMLSMHEVLLAEDGEKALALVKDNTNIDLILLDLRMPRMNGFTFLDRLKQLQCDIPVIILTNSEEVEMEIQGLERGAVDYIRKPLNLRSLQKRIDVQLRLKQATQLIKDHNRHLEELVEKRTAEIRRTNDITINALVRLLEVRNVESSNHSLRTKTIMELLCRQLQTISDERYHLSAKQIQELVATTPLHDIGKVGIPDSILLKPGRLEPDEITIMRQHVSKGEEALIYSAEGEDIKISFIETARELIASHHEWFDGSGYPRGLAGMKIPLSGRLMAVIDVYDALISKRVYKAAFNQEQAIQVMKNEALRHFDPVIFEAFLTIAPRLPDILQEN